MTRGGVVFIICVFVAVKLYYPLGHFLQKNDWLLQDVPPLGRVFLALVLGISGLSSIGYGVNPQAPPERSIASVVLGVLCVMLCFQLL